MTQPMDQEQPRIELLGIAKSFGATQAVDQVSLRLMAGEVHALVGENGAGKSTLMNVLFGMVQPDAGTIRVEGHARSWRSAQDAMKAGLGMVHQHFMQVPSMTVLDNILLGAEPCDRWGFISRDHARARLREIEARHGLGVDPDLLVQQLSVGERQRVEILKMLFRGARVMILDEPTAVLTPTESQQLFEIVRGFRDSGLTVVMVTHKLAEVMALSDRVTVMRAGRVVAQLRTLETNVAEIGEAMMGQRLTQPQRNASLPADAPLRLAAHDLQARTSDGRAALRGTSFDLRAGEIVGLAGVAGNGQQALIAALSGMLPLQSGVLQLEGRDISAASVRERLAAGLSVVPEDRARLGLAADASVWANALAGLEAEPRFAQHGLLRMDVVRAYAQELLERYDVRPRDIDRSVRELSGGNQQKLMLARALERCSHVLVVENPTWGVDIGAVQTIHARLRQQAAAGCAVLVVSSDLDEIRELCHRLLVMNKGRISGGMDCDAIIESQLALWMGGGAEREAA